MYITSEEVPTHLVEVHIAGNYDQAKKSALEYCNTIGLCVSITKQDFVYSGGIEQGVCLKLVNYPRFPSNHGELNNKAYALAEKLLQDLGQRTALVISHQGKTFWLKRTFPFEERG